MSANPADPYRERRVQSGEALWAIAGTELGDPFRWPEIAAASAEITQPDGGRLADPNLIRTGWTLRIPTTPAPSRDRGAGAVAVARHA